jgi:ParB/RepB/Spo0J family partition protein
MSTDTTATPALPELRAVPIAELKEHPLNARKVFDAAAILELEASIREHGIHTPLLVRGNGKGYEILGGHRRFRCAQKLGLARVPVLVRQLDDDQALELMLIDNLQREGLHPLEEAAGYAQLLKLKSKYDVERLANRMGRGIKYVYDRVRLLELSADAQQLFRGGEFGLGQAIVLARLTPAQQKRAIGGPLFQHEDLLFDRDDRTPHRKAISARELQAWVDEHVSLEADAAKAQPLLFAETVDVLKAAEATNEKVVRITYKLMTPEALRDAGDRAIVATSWKRADGKRGSKACEFSVIGMVVIGVHRGDAFRVCVDKKHCAKHWPDQVKAAKKRAAAASSSSTSSPSSSSKTGSAQKAANAEAAREAKEAAEEMERQLEEARWEKAEGAILKAAAEMERQLEEARWEKAEGAILKAAAVAFKKAPAGAATPVGKHVLEFIRRDLYLAFNEADRHMGKGKTADDLVRYLAFADFWNRFTENDREDAAAEIERLVGVHLAKIVDEVAPREPRCRECGCTEAKACTITIPGEGPRGCSWLEKPSPKTGLGLCSAPRCAKTRHAKKPAKKK